jgi:NitT/TauT family transport system substrate-binding protein
LPPSARPQPCGAADLGTTGFTQPLVDHAREDPLHIVGGSGKLGMALMGRPGTSMRTLRGKRAGTFEDDPMEVLLYDALRLHGMSGDDVERVPYASLTEAVGDLLGDRIAALTLVEPWISRLAAQGFEVLCDGRQAMLDAQRAIEADPRAALRASAHRYAHFTVDELLAGIAAQPPVIDIRPLRQCILARAASLQALGRMHATGALDDIFSFDLLERALAASSAPAMTDHSPVQPR